MRCRALLRTLFPFAALALLVSCAEVETMPPVAPAPAPTPPLGYWEGDGVSGAPKIVVSISDQRAYFYKGKHLVGESTVSTGKPGFSTPPGQYTVLSKSPDHVSTVFGDYVDDFGNVVKSNIDVRKDPKPPGAHYDGARMPFAMFFRGGYAMHQGYVPPYAASHGCIRLPQGMAETFFDNAPVGTPVIVKQEAVMHSAPLPVFNPEPPPPSRVVQYSAPPAVRPAPVRTTVPVPTPAPLQTPAPRPYRAPVPLQTPAPFRSPSPAAVRSPAPTPTPKPSRTHRRVRSRANVRFPAPSPTPTPAPRQ